MKNRMIALAAMLATSCTADQSPPAPRAQSQRSDMLYICYSHATCNGVRVDQRHELCTRSSADDVLIQGDAAAQDWVLAWRATCSIDQGLVVGLDVGKYCLQENGQPSTWGCEASCEPAFEACR